MSQRLPLRRLTVARSPALVLAIVLSCFLAAGCHSNRRNQKEPTPQVLYDQGHHRLVEYDYKGAIRLYESLIARYPFSDQARQARIDLIYAYYKNGESDSATDAADTFVRENPTHPRVDYAWYIKGLVDFERQPNVMERLFHADLSKLPPVNARKSFDAFKTVVDQYPKSAYAPDARQRMVYLRNQLADYDVHVAQYYMRRGAYVGAANRANDCVEQFVGAPANRQALQIMMQAYDKLGLKQREAQVREVYDLNFANMPTDSRKWWHFW
jgi:outer membrane protein assembly factor BamD